MNQNIQIINTMIGKIAEYCNKIQDVNPFVNVKPIYDMLGVMQQKLTEIEQQKIE